MINKELSIIIPMFNAQNTIDKCITSIENQKVKYPFEIIIVDDGSTDDSILTLQKIKENFNNIKIIRQNNLKQSEARNNGLSYASGKYVMFLDCDDKVEPGMLSKMINLIKENNDLVMCGIRKIYTNEVIIENDSSLTKAQSKRELLEKILTKNKEFDVGLWNKIFRMDIIRKNHLIFENENFFEDSLFVFKYLYFCNFEKIVFLDDVFYDLYKRNGKSTTTKFDSNIDALANNYINKIDVFLNKMNFKISNEVFNSFKLRVYLHLVHHHIKYDDEWNRTKQKEKLSFINFNELLRLRSNLDSNYWLAFFIAKYLPYIYMYLYKNRC